MVSKLRLSLADVSSGEWWGSDTVLQNECAFVAPVSTNGGQDVSGTESLVRLYVGSPLYRVKSRSSEPESNISPRHTSSWISGKLSSELEEPEIRKEEVSG